MGGLGGLVTNLRKNVMSDNEAEQRVFTSLGLTQREWAIYTFLCKTGPLKAFDIARNLRFNRDITYGYLKNLQKNGLVEATLERPQKFLAVSPKKLKTLCIDIKKNELRKIITDLDVLSEMLSFSSESYTSEERAAIMQGYDRIFSRAKRMLNECNTEFLCLYCENQDEASLLSAIELFIRCASRKHNAMIRMIVNLSLDASKTARIIKLYKSYNLRLEIRYTTSDKVPSDFIIRDKEEALIGLSNMRTIVRDEETKGLWTNSRLIAETLEAFFNKIWDRSSPLCPLSAPSD